MRKPLPNASDVVLAVGLSDEMTPHTAGWRSWSAPAPAPPPSCRFFQVSPVYFFEEVSEFP